MGNGVGNAIASKLYNNKKDHFIHRLQWGQITVKTTINALWIDFVMM